MYLFSFFFCVFASVFRSPPQRPLAAPTRMRWHDRSSFNACDTTSANALSHHLTCAHIPQRKQMHRRAKDCSQRPLGLVSLPLWLTQLFFYSTIRLLVSARAVGTAAVSASMRRRLRTRRRWTQTQLVTWQCDDNSNSGNDLKWPQHNEDTQETFA